jgi:cellulose synthase (UDP-forming)
MSFSLGDLFTFADPSGIWGKALILAEAMVFIAIFFLIARRFKILKKPFIILAMAIQAVYIGWRIAFTIPLTNPAGIIVGILLLGAEILGAFQATTHRILYMKEPKQVKMSLRDLGYLPSVDVLICTYNEPVKVIEKTIAAATALAYPKELLTVYVCDDGRREEARAVSEKYGAVWVTRPDNRHAKAGNLNNCLQYNARAEYFLVLDADVVVKRNFLQRTLGYFHDEKVAFVQAPQVFYTPDPFQYNLFFKDKIPNEQDFFMREIQPRRAAFNATLFVGSNGVFRRSAIDEIGLIPTESITEDIATSLVLQSHGYSGVTVDEVLAVGLSAESFTDYVSQHVRWCRGNIQVLKKYKPLTRKGLTPMQRVLYFDGIIYWLFGLQKIIYVLCPIFFLLTAIPIFYSDIMTMAVMFIPTFFISMLIFRLFSYKNRSFTWAHLYEMALAPFVGLSALMELVFSGKLKFKVTPKGNSRKKTVFSWRVALPNMVLTAASLAALGLGIYKSTADALYMLPVYLLNIGWLLYNLWGLVMNILVCIEKPRLRTSERLTVNEYVTVFDERGRLYVSALQDISEGGCGLLIREGMFCGKADEKVRVQLEIGGEMLPGKIIRMKEETGFVAIRFDELSAPQFVEVVKFIFDKQETGYGAFQKKTKHGKHSVGEDKAALPALGIPSEAGACQ